MAVLKEVVVDKIEVLEHGHIQVRRATYYVENGVRTLAGFHRIAYEPGVDVKHEDARVQDVATIMWTPDVVRAHQDRVAANTDPLPSPRPQPVPNTVRSPRQKT